MTSRPPTDELLNWALDALAPASTGVLPVLSAVAGDASNRRYFRAVLEDFGPCILVDSPPATEKNAAFLAVRAMLADVGVTVPALHAADLERGYLALGDLGDRLLLAELDQASADERYREAMAVLLRVAAIDTSKVELPAYDETLLAEELSRFPRWFVEALLGVSPEPDEMALLQNIFDKLIGSALEQPRVVVHRDFHSRNLMPQDDGRLGVIDFQDAVLGPITYDLVSLLRDCYIQWSPAQVQYWALAYRALLQARGLPAATDDDQFMRWFDLMGLQRHIKVLGTFARLYLRDGKPSYLADLPLVVSYVQEIAGKYAAQDAAMAEFKRWFEQRLSPLIACSEWGLAS